MLIATDVQVNLHADMNAWDVQRWTCVCAYTQAIALQHVCMELLRLTDLTRGRQEPALAKP